MVFKNLKKTDKYKKYSPKFFVFLKHALVAHIVSAVFFIFSALLIDQFSLGRAFSEGVFVFVVSVIAFIIYAISNIPMLFVTMFSVVKDGFGGNPNGSVLLALLSSYFFLFLAVKFRRLKISYLFSSAFMISMMMFFYMLMSV